MLHQQKAQLKSWLLLQLLAGLLSPTCGATEYGNAIATKVISIYDADTFTVNIANWPDIIGYRIPVRVKGVDAPELRGRCQQEKELARLAKQYTVQALRNAKAVELKNLERGKYFRLLADVYVDGKNLAQELIREGHGRLYNGGARQGWCD